MKTTIPMGILNLKKPFVPRPHEHSPVLTAIGQNLKSIDLRQLNEWAQSFLQNGSTL